VQIDHKLEFGRLLNWQFRGMCALQYLVDVDRGVSPDILDVSAIGYEPANINEWPQLIHGRKATLRREIDNFVSVTE